MERMFSITIGKKRNEFSLIGIADLGHGTAKYQGLLNGIPFTESTNYERVRARVLKAVEINSPSENKDAS